jgi:hypothetical protein
MRFLRYVDYPLEALCECGHARGVHADMRKEFEYREQIAWSCGCKKFQPMGITQVGEPDAR